MSKKIVIASDSFKGSATSKEIGEYISNGIHSLFPDYETSIFSIADGGEGTIDAILNVNKGREIVLSVQDPFGKQIQAKYALIDNGETAIIEMAEASGITLVSKDELDILNASTYGTGELIRDAIDRKVKQIYIGIGGSATNDGGIGMANALGVKFLDKNQQELAPIGANLEKITEIDKSNIHPGIKNVDVFILSDVTNPLCGPTGAAAVYGPQKGATKEIVERLDAGLFHYADIIKQSLGIDIKDVEGAGAAGGLGAGLLVFLKANSQRGIDKILKLIHIEEEISNADFVITGEGSMDGQSANGKAPIGIAQISKKYGVPTVAIVGSKALDMEDVFDSGIAGIFDIINRPMDLEEAIKNTQSLVEATAKNIINLFSTLNK